MKTKFLLLPFACTLLLAACNKNSDYTPSVTEPGLIAFSADGDGINTQVSTKASPVTSLTSFNVTASKGTTETAVFENVSFTGAPNYTGGKFWPSTDQSYHFYASNASMTFSPSAVTVSPANANTDVIVAKLATPTYKASNKLTFKHVFARIGTITLNAPAGYTLSGTPTFALSAPVSGTYDIKSDAWSVKGTAAAQTLGSGANDVWVVPGTYELSVTYTLTKGDYTQTFTKKASVALAQGKISNITATAPDGAASGITLTVELTPWETTSLSITLG